MKKSILIDGKERGSITVSRQVYLMPSECGTGDSGRAVAPAGKTQWSITGTIGLGGNSMGVVSISHVDNSDLISKVDWAYDYVAGLIQDLDKNIGTLATLKQKGFTL